MAEVPEEGSPREVPEDVPEEEVPEVPEVPPEQPKRGRGRPRKDPSAPPKPKKQAVVPDARATREGATQEGVTREAPEPRSEVDNILYLFKQREIEERRRKSGQYKQMLGL